MEKQYAGEEKSIMLSESELKCMLDEAKAKGRESLLQENRKLKATVQCVNDLLRIIFE